MLVGVIVVKNPFTVRLPPPLSLPLLRGHPVQYYSQPKKVQVHRVVQLVGLAVVAVRRCMVHPDVEAVVTPLPLRQRQFAQVADEAVTNLMKKSHPPPPPQRILD
jgi:hypothetical protein